MPDQRDPLTLYPTCLNDPPQPPISQQTANPKLNPMIKISNLKYKIKENIY